MKKPPAAVMVAAGIVVLAAVAVVAVPHLQRNEAVVDRAAARQVEKARRILWQFSENEERLAVLLAQLTQAGVDTKLSDEQANRVAGGEVGRELLAEEEQRLAAITGTRGFADFGRDAGSVAQAIRDGAKGRDALLAENDKLLADALAAVQEALGITEGNASSANDVNANRLKAAILFHQGVASHRRAQELRSQAESRRRTLVGLAQDVQASQIGADLVARSQVAERIVEAESRLADLRKLRADGDVEIQNQQAQIHDVEARLARARTTAEQGRAAMEEMEDRGLDLADPQGFEKFATQYRALGETYRQAIREAQELETGAGPAASPERAEARAPKEAGHATSGPAPARGLAALRSDLEQLNTERKNFDELVEAAERDVIALNQLKEQYAARAKAAQDRMAELRAQAQSVYADLTRLLAEAESVEDSAIRSLDGSVAAGRLASSEAGRRVSDAGSSTAPPEKLERLPAGLIQHDGWIQGSIECQESAARIRQSLVHYDRFRDAAADAELLPKLESLLRLPGIDAAELSRRRDGSVQAGIQAATEADDLASRAGRGLEQHWTVPALVADARYVLVLFGRNDLRQNVIDNYRAAIDGRETSPFVEAYLSRLESLETGR